MFMVLNNIYFSHIKGKSVLNNVSFSLQKGETLAIVGASGSGKSTILRLISGILPAAKQNDFSGSISINNQFPVNYVKEGKLSFMFQEPTLFPNLSVKENIALPLKVKNQSDVKKVNHLIDIVGLSGFENYLPKDLSGGMKTRVALARSFVTNPELLLLDEPFSSLDIAWQDALYHELKELKNESGTTVVLVTHDITEAIALSDKIICLSIEGKTLLEEPNTRSKELHSLIEGTIIRDHQLRKLNEKKNHISVA